MYAYLKGVVADKGANELVLDVGGVGYLLSCSMTTLQETPSIGETMKAYTYFSVREDAMELFGFATPEEKSMFLRLLSVSGVGPKLALSILGAMPLRDLALAALQALGYTPAEAARAVSLVRGQSDSANELVRLALRGMAGM